MPDPLPAFVLHSKAATPKTLDDAAGNPAAGGPARGSSDEQLMFAFCHGSADAFAELFSRYKQPLFGFFRRRIEDIGLAEELTQETFVAVLRASSRYGPRCLFRTYLYAIGFKTLRAHRRKAAFRSRFFSSDPEDYEPAAEDSIDTQLFLRHAVSRLQPQNREVLLLREFEQLSYAEIAELLKLPINTVRTRLCRARLALRDILAEPARQSSPPQSSPNDLSQKDASTPRESIGMEST